jgi:hypothetical protein
VFSFIISDGMMKLIDASPVVIIVNIIHGRRLDVIYVNY